jgi:NitT/TauT family transport system permease protein
MWALVAIVVLIAIWEIIVLAGNTSQSVLPNPLTVAQTFVDNGSLIYRNSVPTALEALYGFLVSAALGIPLGWLIARPSKIQPFINTLVVGAQIFPKVTIAPVFVVWLGFGYVPKVLYIVLLTFFPITINTAAGYRSIPANVRDLARILELSWWSRTWKIELPCCLPSIFTGLKTSASLAVIGAIVAEFVGATQGIGYLVLQAGTSLDTPLMFAAIIGVTIVGFIFYGLVVLCEVLLIPWHVSQELTLL